MSSNLVDLGRKLLDASRNGHTDSVLALTQSGAPFTTDWLGTTPLHLAARYGHTASAEILLKAGASRDARTKLDRTALHVAAQEGHLQMVELLLAHGADSNARDMLKMTPLHWAVQRCHISIVERLLIGGSDPAAVSKFFVTPYDMAEELGYLDILRLLQSWTRETCVIGGNIARVPATSMSESRGARIKTEFTYTTTTTTNNGDAIKKAKLQMNCNPCVKLEVIENKPANKKYNITTINNIMNYQTNNQTIPPSGPESTTTTDTTISTTSSVATCSSLASITENQHLKYAHSIKPQPYNNNNNINDDDNVGTNDIMDPDIDIKVEPNLETNIHDGADSRRLLIANIASGIPDTVDAGWLRSAVAFAGSSNDAFSQYFFSPDDHLDELTEDDYDLDLWSIGPDTVDVLNFDRDN